MRMSCTHRLVRWAYFAASYTPAQTNLCAVFWRSVLVTPLKLLGLAFFLYFVVYALLIYPVLALGWWGLLSGPIVAGLLMLSVLASDWFRRCPSTSDSGQPSVLATTFRAMKARYCPIIEIDWP
jgi:hypothetical protein